MKVAEIDRKTGKSVPKKDWKRWVNPAWLTIFPPNWGKGQKAMTTAQWIRSTKKEGKKNKNKSGPIREYCYRGADGKPILPFSIVVVDFSAVNEDSREWYRKHFPWKEGTQLLFICEVRFTDGHCVVADQDGKLQWLCHTNEFRMLTDEEV
jgi:hypothetical protein